MRAHHWADTAVGDPDTWPQSLRSTISMLLPSKAQIILFWGPEFTVFYNDAYRPVFGAKHPHALGLSGRKAWSEIWDSMLHELLAGVVRTGEAFWAKDLLFTVERYGFVEETYFDVSYDPVRVESGAVGGVFCIVTETTERVVGERRMTLLKDLAARNATARTLREACMLAMETLAARPEDVTFALTYLDGELQCQTPGAAEQLAQASPDLVRRLAVTSGAGVRSGQLVVGLNPRRPFDESYRAFVELVADQVSTTLTNARAYEEERQRAEALAEIDRAKTAFFSNVSHEFRTPLTLLLGPVQDALSGPDRSLGGDALATVNRNALRLLKLVNTLLDFARIEAGRAQATYEITDLAAFTTDLAGAFRSAIESAGLEFDVQCDPIGDPAYVDRAMWEKIVFNLLSNALKFTFEGRIRLHLARTGHDISLTVSDSGVGISAEELPQIFQRFHRVRTTRARTHEGTGIGLALVQELVRLHGGTIAAESRAGEGTTFTITIPVGHAHLAGESIGEPRSLSSTSVSADAYVSEALGWVGHGESLPSPPISGERPARILLADDNADMRDYVARLLGDRWHVETVSDGAAALEAVRHRRPDIVITDVMMPAIDGFELLAALRADPATQNIAVILLSARAGEEATLRGIKAGADDYLVKPFTARDLIARVDAQVARARTREAIQDRMALVEGVLDNVPVGVFLVDQDFRLAYVNPLALPVFGDIPGLVGRTFDDVAPRLMSGESADEMVQIFRQTLATGEPYFASERTGFLADLGRTAHYDWRTVRVEFPDNRLGVVCYFRDVSAHVMARQAIAESEQRFRAFVTATSDVVYRMSADWTEMRELEGRDFIADTRDPSRAWIEKYIHPADHPAVMAAIRHAIETKSTFELEHRVYRLDGTLGWTISRAVPIVDARGEIVEWLGNARDVTARKRDEEALRRSEQELAEANRAKDVFLATLSHELRTPLNAVLGWAHMLRTGTLRADAQDRALQSLERNAKAQAQLVDDLLDVSRIMSGKLVIAREPLDLTAVIAAAVDTIRPSVESKRLHLRVGIDGGAESFVEGDAVRLQQVVSNLLSNAVKFTPEQGAIDVDLRHADDQVELVVQDSGSGIDPAFLPHVFDRFRQGDSSTSRKHGGLGLGLAIVRHLTEAHGGNVSAYSDGIGTGATFVVRLPRAAHRRRTRPIPLLAPRPVNHVLHGVTVLVVDDDPDARELAKVAVESSGARATAVENAEQVLRILEQERFDVLIADIGMPGQDGFSLMRTIRRRTSDDGGTIRAIAVSAYATERDREEALAAGFDDHLGKPTEPDMLVSAVAALAT